MRILACCIRLVTEFPFDSAAMVVQPKRRAILNNLTSYGIVIDQPYDAIFNEEVYEHPMWKLRYGFAFSSINSLTTPSF